MSFLKTPLRVFLLQLVAVVMLVGQLHVCPQVYQHANGVACTERHEGASIASVHAPDHNHEHECELRPCHNPVGERVFLANLLRDHVSDAALLSPDPPSIWLPGFPERAPLVWLNELSLPTGPRLSRSSRAPPAFLQPA